MDTMTTDLYAAGALKLGDRVFSSNYGADLTVVQIGYGKGADIEDVLAGKIGAETIHLSADGRAFITSKWHTGGGGDEATYVEVLRKNGRDFHGWVHATTRRLVQAG